MAKLFIKKYKDSTVKEYLNALSAKIPVPGGGSAAGLVGSLGASLLSMVANYSLNRNQPQETEKKIKNIFSQSEKIKKRLLALVDLDAQAYMKVVKARQSSPKIKQAALSGAREVPQEVCSLCYQAIELTPFIVKHGNKRLLSDIQVAVELLLASFNAAMVLART